jgi:serine protease
MRRVFFAPLRCLRMGSDAVLWGLLAVFSACFEVKELPEPAPAPGGVISGRIFVGDVEGARAEDPTAVARARRDLAAASPRTPAVVDGETDATPLNALDVRGRPEAAPERPAAMAGEAVVFFERGHFDAVSLQATVTQMLRDAGAPKVRAEVVSCAGRMFCRVLLVNDEGFLVDEDTTVVVERLNKVKASGVTVVARNVIHHGFREPNDEFYGLQWHYAKINLPLAWDFTVGDPSLVVAVVDSGIVHGNPDLQERVARDPDNGNQFVEMDFVTVEFSIDGDGLDLNAEDPGDGLPGTEQGSFHGTHVAGIIGAETDNEIGVAGVLWEAQIVPVRVLGQGLQGTLSDILTGLLWAVGDLDTGAPPNQRPAKIVNMSLGADSDIETQQAWEQVLNAILDDDENLYPQNPILVVAAGNDGKDANAVAPANIGRLITVGASRLDGLRAEYSNFGSVIDFLAPGGELSLDLNNDNQPDGVLSTLANDVAFEQGTSMAAPHATGVAGLLVAARPELTHDEVHQILVDTADRSSRCNEGCGAGLMDALQALFVTGVERDPEPRLAVDTQTVVFRSGIERRGLRVLNLGSEQGDFVVSIDGAQAAHFSVTPTTGRVAATENVELTITLDRRGLRAGSANLHIEGAADAAGQLIDVVLTFNDTQPTPLAGLDFVEVAAYERDDTGGLVRVGRAEAQRTNSFAYEITGLPDGVYEVRAVGDDNGDGTFDAQFESIGAWPDTGRPQTVTIDDEERVEEIDFAISPRFVVTVDNGVGAPCSLAQGHENDCAGIDFAPDAACIAAFPGGYCSRICDDGLCGGFARCETLTCGDDDTLCNVCLQRCANSSQCREGYVCSLQTCVPVGFDDEGR